MSLHHLGMTRSRRAVDHLLQTPDTFVWAPMPGMVRATACIHASPALGAGFAQYTVVFEAGGTWLSGGGADRFLYVLEGRVFNDWKEQALGAEPLGIGEFCYVSPGEELRLRAESAARIVVIEKNYIGQDGVAMPRSLRGTENEVASAPLLDDAGVQVRALLPDDESFDFAVNTMTYQPGARLSMVEVHVMEHGLLMLEGEGIYRLGDAWYPVKAGDFIWMAPYCPQWFGALGGVPAKYLIYKDWNRGPLAGEAGGRDV